MAAFDSRRVAEAVARSQVPVLTGLGHQIDESIADKVAHTALKTPTKVAEYLIDRITTAERARLTLERELVTAVRGRFVAAVERHRLIEGRARVAGLRLTAARLRLDELGRFLARTARRLPAAALRAVNRAESELGKRAPRVLAEYREVTRRLTVDLERGVRGRLATARATLEGKERLARELGPERVLARGFSITRDETGRALRRAAEIGYGRMLSTQLGHGSIKSRVEEE